MTENPVSEPLEDCEVEIAAPEEIAELSKEILETFAQAFTLLKDR